LVYQLQLFISNAKTENYTEPKKGIFLFTFFNSNIRHLRKEVADPRGVQMGVVETGFVD